MTGQLELFAPAPAAAPPPARFDPDATLRGLPRNTQGSCCGHWRAEHDDPGGCRFCDCQQFTGQPAGPPPCCRTGVTGHCTHGRHDQCPYSPGNTCHGGITRTHYLLIPPRDGWPGTNPTPDLHVGNAILDDVDAAVDGCHDMVEVIEPLHRIVCGCHCHDTQVGQCLCHGVNSKAVS